MFIDRFGAYLREVRAPQKKLGRQHSWLHWAKHRRSQADEGRLQSTGLTTLGTLNWSLAKNQIVILCLLNQTKVFKFKKRSILTNNTNKIYCAKHQFYSNGNGSIPVGSHIICLYYLYICPILLSKRFVSDSLRYKHSSTVYIIFIASFRMPLKISPKCSFEDDLDKVGCLKNIRPNDDAWQFSYLKNILDNLLVTLYTSLSDEQCICEDAQLRSLVL